LKASIRKRIEAANALLAAPKVKQPSVPKSRKRKQRAPLSKKILPISGIAMDDVAPAAKNEALSLERMMYLRVAGATYLEIAMMLGCTEGNIVTRLKPYREKIDSLRDFQENKGNLYDLKQQDLYAALTPEKIEDMPGRDIIQGMKTLEEMSRKVNGLDMHQNINIFSLTVKAAHALPVRSAVKQLKEVVNGESEGVVGDRDPGGELEELPGCVRGTELSPYVGQEDMQALPRYGEPGLPLDGDCQAGGCGEALTLQLHVEGRDYCAGTSEDLDAE